MVPVVHHAGGDGHTNHYQQPSEADPRDDAHGREDQPGVAPHGEDGDQCGLAVKLAPTVADLGRRRPHRLGQTRRWRCTGYRFHLRRSALRHRSHPARTSLLGDHAVPTEPDPITIGGSPAGRPSGTRLPGSHRQPKDASEGTPRFNTSRSLPIEVASSVEQTIDFSTDEYGDSRQLDPHDRSTPAVGALCVGCGPVAT